MESGLVVGDRYLVVQLIGQGGMGAVFDAIHAKTGRRVALKLIHERLVTSRAGRRRFEREARAAASIDSLHVVQILDSGEDERSGIPYLVMEFLQGDDLRSLLQRGPLPERLATIIALQICRGLEKAHELDIVHRDLKPANVFVARTDGGRRVLKVLDFGIAKFVAEGDDATATATADVIGSPAYMSPEQLRTPGDVDALTDVWSLGVVLYEMLAGRTPTAAGEAIGARVYAICHTPAPPVRTFAPHVSPELAEIVDRALAIDRHDRMGSIGEMAAALDKLVPRGTEILEQDLAAHTSEPATSSLAHETNGILGPPEAKIDAPSRPRRWASPLMGAGVVVSLGVVAVLRLTAPSRPNQERQAAPTVEPAITAASLPSSPSGVNELPPPASVATKPASPTTAKQPSARPVPRLGTSSGKRGVDGKRSTPTSAVRSIDDDGREAL